MTRTVFKERISSFFDIQREIISGDSAFIEFSEEEKSIYLAFANCLSDIYSKIDYSSEYKSNIDSIIMELENVYKNSMLEENIQNHNSIANCFVKGGYRYYSKIEIPVLTVKGFLQFIKSVTKDKQKIILNNIWQRLDIIDRFSKESGDDLPF